MKEEEKETVLDVVKEEIESAKDYTKENKSKVKEGILIILLMLVGLSAGFIGGHKIEETKESKEEKVEKIDLSEKLGPAEDLFIYQNSDKLLDAELPEGIDKEAIQVQYIVESNNSIINYLIYFTIPNSYTSELYLYNINGTVAKKLNKDYVYGDPKSISTKNGSYIEWEEINTKECSQNRVVYNITNSKKLSLISLENMTYGFGAITC